MAPSTNSDVHVAPYNDQWNPEFRTDPLKGQWGGHARRNGRMLSATVSPRSPGWYSIRLVVRPEPSAPPLNGPVRFHLHPSFRLPFVTVEPDEHGEAVLELDSYGSFTVGAETDIRGRSSNQLELDLAELPNVPEEFRHR